MLALALRAMAVLAFTACSSALTSLDGLKYVTLNGERLAYVERGKGDPVILVHGGLQDYRFWNDLLDSLSERHRVIAYSRRNHFPNTASDDGAPDGAADIHGNDLASFVHALKLGPIQVVAHSSGAVAALHFAANNPQLVGSMVLNEPPATSLLAKIPGGPALLKEQGSRLAAAREAFIARDLQNAIRLFIDGVGGPGSFERRSELGKRMALDNAVSQRADNTTNRPRPTFTCEDAKRISAPVLLTTGAQSSNFFRAIVDELERCLPRAQRVVIPKASHSTPNDNPRAFSDAVQAFLAK